MINLRKLGDNVAVHCPTEEEAKELMIMADEQGITWGSSRSCLDYTYYDIYGDKTCYTGFNTSRISYGNYDFYKKQGYTIIEFLELEQYLNSEEKKEMTYEEMIEILEADEKCRSGAGNCIECPMDNGISPNCSRNIVKMAIHQALSILKHQQDKITKLKQKINELKTQLETQPSVEPIKWKELDKYIGKPVYMRNVDGEEWFILKGYSRDDAGKNISVVTMKGIRTYKWYPDEYYPCEVE